ncbi:MAG: hypothetical protein HDS96_00305 [Bacteroidales bacterium]|nr:hypothetical protein [Bacteroidales bacterium]
MKNYIKFCIIGLTMGILLCGCKSDSHDPAFVLTDANFSEYVPDVPAYWIGQFSGGSGGSGANKQTWIEFDAELIPLFNPTFWGIKIDKVVFFFDGKEISSLSNAPYKVKYSVTNPSHGNHTLLAEIHVSGKTLSPHIMSVRKTLYNQY